MLKKLWVLIKLQLSEKLKWKRSDTKAHKAGVIAKKAVGMLAVYAVFTLLFYVIFRILSFQPTIDMFIFFIFLLQLISIIMCIIEANDSLYQSKDNAILLTYPVKHGWVFLSKIIVLYISELIKSVTFVLPLFMSYMTIVNSVISVNYILSSILFSVVLPLMPVLIGSILAIPFTFISRWIKNTTVGKAIATVLLLGVLITITAFAVKGIESIAPIRITALWNRFNETLTNVFHQVNYFALYANFVGRAMCGTTFLTCFLNHLFMLLVVVGLAGLTILIAWPTFYALASSNSENSTTRKHKGKNVVHKSTFGTFMRKEATLSLRNIAGFAGDYIFLFLMPFVMIIFTVFIVNIDRNSLGFSLTYGVIGLVVLIMLCASNTASATAISSEGNEFTLLKTAPGKTTNIIWSKLLINFIIALISLLITFISLSFILLPEIEKGLISAGRLWIIFIFVVLIECGLLLWSIQLDITNPKLREFANSKDKASIKNSSTSIFIGILFSVIFSVILIIVNLINLPEIIVCLILIAVGLAFTGLRLYFLLENTKAFFEDIQL